jgi:GT2 family glycosyltransferase/spore maturation protein CgeB
MADPNPPDERLADEVKRLTDRIEGLRHELDLAREMVRQSAERNAKLNEEVRRLRALRRRLAVRIALAIARRLTPARKAVASVRDIPRRVRRFGRRFVRGVGQPNLRATSQEEAVLAEAVRADLPGTSVRGGELVSIVILNRNGGEHFTRCLTTLARTSYRDVELIVVDNASTDGSDEIPEQMGLPFPVKVIRNAENRSFSEANDQGVAAATGSLICFLNNDIEPITDDWLGYMVETLGVDASDAVGARLIYPSHRGTQRAGGHIPDLRLQHAGVEFDRTADIPLPRPIGAGESPIGPEAASVVRRPALTAACLLIRRAAFEAIGGFSLDYEYGLEDVDLCLRLQAAGMTLTYDGRAALWHHESATRAADRNSYAERVARNRKVFVDTWGPRIFREAFLDAIDGAARLSSSPFHVALTVSSHDPSAGYGDWFTAHELGDALAAFGWRVDYIAREGDEWYRGDPGVDAVVVLHDSCDIRRLPRRAVTVAWARAWPDKWLDREWFDDFDIVFASSERIAELVRERSSKVAALLPLATNPERFAPSTPDPTRECDVLFVGNFWGQHRHIAEALPQLARNGLRVAVYGKGWDQLPEFAGIHKGYLAYDDIPAAYASARVVVDDAAMPTIAYGSVNSRVFDALGTGAIVVTNGRLGVEGLFDPEFPTWTDAASLVRVVRDVIADPGPARRLAARHREAVLQSHTYAARAVAVREALRAWAASVRYGIWIGVPNVEVQEQWGDYHFGRSLQRALEREGRPTRLHILPSWSQIVSAREDVTVHLFGRSEAPLRRGQVNLLWHISHPDLASPQLYDRYDTAFVASEGFAAGMASVAAVPVLPLHQATDPERFFPDATGPHHELLLVANSRKTRRRIVDDLAGTTRDFAVYGANWTRNLIDPRYVRGEHVANEELHRFYSSADIVLNDHWDDMRQAGFLSNRLYDALACGAFVISDDVPGIGAEFDRAVVTYRSTEHLHDLVERYLAEPQERRRLADIGRSAVLQRHTFAHRVGRILEIADPLVRARPARVLQVPVEPAEAGNARAPAPAVREVVQVA